MNEMQRGDYWLKVERLRRSLDKKYSSLFYGVIKGEIESFAKEVKRIGTQAAISGLGAASWDEKIIAVLQKMYKEIAVTFGNATFRAVSRNSKKAANPFGLNDEFLDELTSFLIQWGFYLASLMAKTTKDRLIILVTKALTDGLSTEDIYFLILSDPQLRYAKSRSVMIARTEVMRASNYASLKGAEKHPFLVDKMWIATRDARTRRIPKDFYDHWNMDWQTVEYDQPFVSADKVGRPIVVDAPGDPRAPRGFTINCRCAVAFIPRRDANGQLIMK
jgi:uncharacterized protein with gpF-like domain